MKQEQALKAFDYIFFFNANAEFMQPVTREMLCPALKRASTCWSCSTRRSTPNRTMSSPMTATPQHGLYPLRAGQILRLRRRQRRRGSGILQLCHTLDARIRRDLQRSVIALWHDESQINRYILFRKDFRVLTPAFCYPEGWDHLPFPASSASAVRRGISTFRRCARTRRRRSSRRWRGGTTLPCAPRGGRRTIFSKKEADR